MKTKNYHIVGIVPEFKENPWKESPTIFLAQIHHCSPSWIGKGKMAEIN